MSVTESFPEPSPEDLALDAYLGMMGALVDGASQGATEHPDLERFATGQALELANDMLTGARTTGEPVLDPRIAAADLAADPPSIRIEDCVDDSRWLVEGGTAGDEAATRLVEATATRQGDAWKIEELWLEDYGPC